MAWQGKGTQYEGDWVPWIPTMIDANPTSNDDLKTVEGGEKD